MSIKVNKEITNYKENFFNGLTRRATLTIVIVGVCMVAGFIVNSLYVGGEYFQYLMMFVATITAFVGFYNKDGIWGGTFIFLVYRQYMLKKPLNCCKPYYKTHAERLADYKKGKPTIRRVEVSDELFQEALAATADPFAQKEADTLETDTKVSEVEESA